MRFALGRLQSKASCQLDHGRRHGLLQGVLLPCDALAIPTFFAGPEDLSFTIALNGSQPAAKSRDWNSKGGAWNSATVFWLDVGYGVSCESQSRGW